MQNSESIKICRVCRHPIEATNRNDSDNHRMLEVCICGDCDYWVDQWRDRDSVTIARVNGKHYKIGSVGQKEKSMSGLNFVIEYHDGRIIHTDNLLRQGTIPEDFKLVLPDNAEFRR